MKDEIVDDLIQRVLDGEGTPEEARRLQARLASDPEVRERHAQLKQLFDSLAAVRVEDAPAGLHASIMRAVRTSTPVAAAPATVRSTRRPFDFARLFLPVAAGFVAGALGWAALGGSLGPAAPPATVSGAMADLSQPTPLLSLGQADHGVVVSAARADKGSTLLELQSAGTPVQLWLLSDGQAVSLVAEPSNGATAIAGAEGVLAMELAPKSLLRVRCVPAKGAQSVRVTAKLADGSVAEGVLRLEWLPWARRGR